MPTRDDACLRAMIGCRPSRGSPFIVAHAIASAPLADARRVSGPTSREASKSSGLEECGVAKRQGNVRGLGLFFFSEPRKDASVADVGGAIAPRSSR